MKKYIILILVLFGLIFAFTTLNKVAEPYKALSKLPRCSSGIIVTDSLTSSIRNKTDSIVIAGTGAEYFNIHYQFLSMDYHLSDCTFLVKYEYSYETLRQQMLISVRASNETNLETTEVNALVRPVEIAINSTTAELIAAQKGVEYDYYHKEISISQQTIYYRFYKQSLTEGTQVVLELDSQSNEITQLKKPQKFVPLV